MSENVTTRLLRLTAERKATPFLYRLMDLEWAVATPTGDRRRELGVIPSGGERRENVRCGPAGIEILKLLPL